MLEAMNETVQLMLKPRSTDEIDIAKIART